MVYDMWTLTYGLQKSQQTWLQKHISVGVAQVRNNFTLLLDRTPWLAKVNIELRSSSILTYSSLRVWLRNDNSEVEMCVIDFWGDSGVLLFNLSKRNHPWIEEMNIQNYQLGYFDIFFFDEGLSDESKLTGTKYPN